jgi:hypothetical protein
MRVANVWWSVLVFCALFFLSSPVHAATPNQVLIINQVRGEECCDAGSLPHLQQQLQTAVRLKLPTTFTIRFDALADPEFVRVLRDAQRSHPDLITLGIFLEITPSLAKEAGVPYTAPTDIWYQAQHAYPLGLSLTDRQKITDTLVATFQRAFGAKPAISTGWIIDTSTLNYLHDTYGVSVHQITREQWGVDSYTLDGGPPHFPYPASRNWAFIPDFSQENPLMIVRQTITDPVHNYGDLTSSFTGQPNDYSRGKRDLEYFKHLFSQAVRQEGGGFALLGLENSMGEEFQNEYAKQLEIVAGAAREQIVSVIKPAEVAAWQERPLTVYHGRSSLSSDTQEAWWITTTSYRVRLRRQGSTLAITDLRAYSTTWSDPYLEQSGKLNAYWVVPSLLQASLWNDTSSEKPLSAWKRWLLPPQLTLFPPVSMGDIQLEAAEQLTLPSLEGDSVEVKTTTDPSAVTLTDSQGRVLLRATSDSLELGGQGTYQRLSPEAVPLHQTGETNGWPHLRFGDPQHPLVEQAVTCQTEVCQLTFKTSTAPETLTQARQNWYPFLFPEPTTRTADPAKSQLYAHNTYAVAGRNPVRLIAAPKDSHGFLITLSKTPTITTTPKAAYTSDVSTQLTSSPLLIDLINSQPTKMQVEVAMGDVNLKKTVYFAPNCKEGVMHCLTHPRQGWWYLNAVVRDKLRSKLSGEKQ